MNKFNYYQLIRWLLVVIFIITTLTLLYITWFANYVSDVHIAKTLPISILAGSISIAVAIIEKNEI